MCGHRAQVGQGARGLCGDLEMDTCEPVFLCCGYVLLAGHYRCAPTGTPMIAAHSVCWRGNKTQLMHALFLPVATECAFEADLFGQHMMCMDQDGSQN